MSRWHVSTCIKNKCHVDMCQRHMPDMSWHMSSKMSWHLWHFWLYFHFTLVSSYFSLSLSLSFPFKMKVKSSVHSHFKLQERNALPKTQTVRCIRCGWTTILHATRMESPLNLSLDVSLCSQPEAEELALATTGEQREVGSSPVRFYWLWSRVSVALKPFPLA